MTKLPEQRLTRQLFAIFIIEPDPTNYAKLQEMLTVQGYRTQHFVSAEEFLQAHPSSDDGCAIVEVDLPGKITGIELVSYFREQKNYLPIILMSARSSVRMAVAGLQAGAQDFLEKPLHPTTVVSTIKNILQAGAHEREVRASKGQLQARFETLTAHELAVFHLLMKGRSNAEMAKELKLGKRTIEGYRVSTLEKMNAMSVAELVLQANQLGEISYWTPFAD